MILIDYYFYNIKIIKNLNHSVFGKFVKTKEMINEYDINIFCNNSIIVI